jgi:spore germination protein YaaH
MLLALLFALLALGPHAEEAALHAGAPEAAWARAAPSAIHAASAPALDKRVYGYLPYWQSIDLQAFHWELVSDVIAFSADIGVDGALSNSHALPGAALVQAAHAHGVKVHLCATRFNSSAGTEIATFLGSAAARAKAVQQLVSLAQSAGLDGLNLDFEFVSWGGRDLFTAFVQQLHSALRAALPAAELTIAMPSSIGYTGYDAAALAAATERLLLMEYDYHWRTAPTSGANSPLPSIAAALDGFLTKAPAAALALGVPYYGYDWPTATASPGAATVGAGTTVFFSAGFAKFSAWGRLWDSASQTPWYRYLAGAQQHQGWIDDGQSLALKYQLANAKGLAGIMIWALGYDEGRTESWDAIRTAFGSAAPPPPAIEAARGCSQAGTAPIWVLLAAASAGALRGRQPSHKRRRAAPERPQKTA